MALGQRLGEILRPGDVLTFSGDLGTGKTTMIRGVVRGALGVDPVTSPTFVFWHRYRREPPLHHLDLYRIETERDLDELGLEEAFARDAIVLVEWPERAPHLLPADRLDVEMAGVGDAPREILLRPRGARSRELLLAMESTC